MNEELMLLSINDCLLFTLFFIVEGIGFILPRQLNLYFYYAIPAVLSIYFLVKKKTNSFSKKHLNYLRAISVIFINSTFWFSVDKQNSFELTLFYITGFLIFIFFYNNKLLGQQLIKLFVVFGSIVFSVFLSH